MEALGNIEIRIEGSVGNQKLSPALVDIDEIQEVLSQASSLLFPTEKRSQRPRISYEIAEGSVLHRFQTVMQTVVGFGAVLNQISSEGNIDFLHERTAVAVESLQKIAVQHDYVVTLSAHKNQLRVDRSTHYVRSESIWVDAEFYLYGTLTNAGGKNHPNIHLDTEEFGSLRIATNREDLAAEEKNLLYRSFGARVRGRQSLQTFEMDRNSLSLIELFELDSVYSDEYLDSLADKASAAWKDVPDKDAWLKEIRGTQRA